ncbi:hypothetical protein GA0070616_3180 [Micromonospora nigra]|uniref:Uncharacterized protein n=1 Tax=Micromonospora nigra TaxID=145857 RepID=A0A1C6S8J2_9ACTN|nr:hypothetical protein GA0070616_3180 [Micromonospora nigra]
MIVDLNESRRSNAPQLAFNYLPIAFSADKFAGGLTKFESPEQLVLQPGIVITAR